MKRCPRCGREYDASLSFCLDDGAQLLYGPGAIHSSSAPWREAEATLIHSTAVPKPEPVTQIFPAAGDKPLDNRSAIAVLPFVNMSRDEEAEYLSDGLAEELLNVLSKIEGIRVAGRTSSFSFKGKQTTFSEIGQLLNVASVLEGSVRMAGKRVRISVQLVNVADGYHLWSETYDRTMEDIFEIQDDIAQSVVEELRIRLLGKKSDPALSQNVAASVADAAQGRAEDPEAYRLMLLGRHLMATTHPQSALRGLHYLKEALDLSPNFPDCWIELGHAEMICASQGWLDSKLGVGNARAALERALALQPEMAQAYALKARLQLVFDFDFAGAERSIRQAVSLARDNVYVLLLAMTVFGRLGRLNEALDYGRAGLHLDPLNTLIMGGLHTHLFRAGLLDESEMVCRRLLELSPHYMSRRASLGLLLLAKGRVEEARDEAAAEQTNHWRLWSMAIIESAAGNETAAQKMISEIVETYGELAAFQISEIYASRGEIDKAFEWLGLAVMSRDPGLSETIVSVFLKPLHQDPRWSELLDKIGFPVEYR
jgi:adenylate cyclase